MNKMTTTHIGIFLAGAAVGYFVAKSQKKSFSNAIGRTIVFNGDMSMEKAKQFTFTCPTTGSTVYTCGTNLSMVTPGTPWLHGTRAQKIAQACAHIAGQQQVVGTPMPSNQV